jgi:hypothetical protein
MLKPKKPIGTKKIQTSSPTLSINSSKPSLTNSFPSIPIFVWRETKSELLQRENGGTTATTRRRGGIGTGGGGVHSVEEEHAVPLRLDHFTPSRMAVSHCPLGTTLGPTTLPHLRPISRRSKTRPRDPHLPRRP